MNVGEVESGGQRRSRYAGIVLALLFVVALIVGAVLVPALLPGDRFPGRALTEPHSGR